MNEHVELDIDCTHLKQLPTCFKTYIGVQEGNRFVNHLAVKRYWKEVELLQKADVFKQLGCRLDKIIGDSFHSTLKHTDQFYQRLNES